MTNKEENTAKQRDVDYVLDITAEVCPMTFVKTKLMLERMESGKTLEVRLKGAEPLENVPRSAKEYGHEILDLYAEDATADDTAPHRLLIRKV